MFVSGFCNGTLCSSSLSYSVRQFTFTEVNGNTSCELFRSTMVKAYKVLCVEYPLHRGGIYSFPRFCNVNWNFIDPHNTVNTAFLF